MTAMVKVKLSGKNAKANAKIKKYGSQWIVGGNVPEDKVDMYFFTKRDNYLYLTPTPMRARDPEVDIGVNYSNVPFNPTYGAMWVSEKNDPDYTVSEYPA